VGGGGFKTATYTEGYTNIKKTSTVSRKPISV